MAYDPIREEVVMFGVGERGRDTWVWDGATWEQRFPSVVPPGRTSFGMAWDRSRAAVILFGGFRRGGELDDTWAWNGETWSELELDRRPPGAGNMSMSSFGRQVVRYGGLTEEGSSDNTWVLRADRWKRISKGATPSVRAGEVLAYDRAEREAVLFGGYDIGTPGFLDDTWVLER